MRIATPGHAIFAATMIALGILGLVKGDFTPMWTGIPKSMPGREALAYLCAIVCLLAGAGLLWRRTSVAASGVLLGYLIGWLLLVRVSRIFFAPTETDTWWSLGDTAAMTGAAWALYTWFAGERSAARKTFAAGENGLRVARILYGLALIPFGVAHFTYLKETAALVPSWLPFHVGWACLTGATLIVAGVAVLTDVYARLAATLSALEMGLFTVLVWVPIVVAGATPFQWHEFIGSCTLTAAAWVVAESYRRGPWVALHTRSGRQAA
jgi:uncharacterized membrane protein